MITTARHPAFVAHAPEFDEVMGDCPRLSLLAEVDAHEGPVDFADENALYFTTLPRPGADRTPSVQIKRLALEEPGELSVLVGEANGANGMTADADGHLIVCEQGSRRESARISRVDRASGEREPVVEGWRGLPFNSPNDVVVASDGAIWFSDPSYGHLQGFRPEPMVGDFVYRHDPASGQTTVVADGFDNPNGIAFSPDERVLYVTDSGQPGAEQLPRHPPPSHFLFAQMTQPQLAPGWRPGFADYLYTSYTNATAFSPTDTLPLTATAKLLMAIQSSIALITVLLVVARAVNVLG